MKREQTRFDIRVRRERFFLSSFCPGRKTQVSSQGNASVVPPPLLEPSLCRSPCFPHSGDRDEPGGSEGPHLLQEADSGRGGDAAGGDHGEEGPGGAQEHWQRCLAVAARVFVQEPAAEVGWREPVPLDQVLGCRRGGVWGGQGCAGDVSLSRRLPVLPA